MNNLHLFYNPVAILYIDNTNIDTYVHIY